MKKNKMMRVASALLIAVLLTTSAISGTFAKYVTTGSANDTARVAKFGVAIKTSGSLFSDAYVKATGNTPAATWSSSYGTDNISVATSTDSTTDNIVAPGTQSLSDGLTFGISGIPEVATKITATINARDIFLAAGDYGVMIPAIVNIDNFAALQGTNKLYTYASGTYTLVAGTGTYSSSNVYYTLTSEATIAASGYYPVVYSLAGSTATSGTGIAASSTKAVANAILSALKGTAVTADGTLANGLYTYTIAGDDAQVFDPNTDLAAAGGAKMGNEVLTWVWTFENTDMDNADTVLGDMIAEMKGNSADLNVVVKSGDTYKDVTYNSTDFLVTDGTNTIASLKTSFDITLTVTQID